MEVRFAMHPSQFKTLTTEEIRKEFLIENLFEYGKNQHGLHSCL